MLEACVRDELNLTAERLVAASSGVQNKETLNISQTEHLINKYLRIMVVTKPIEVKILNTDTPLPFTTDVPNIDTTSTHPVVLKDVFYIDGDDFREVGPPRRQMCTGTLNIISND